MKVRRSAFGGSATRRLALVVVLSAILLLATNVAPAQAITRAEVMKRSKYWIKRKVKYSQKRYFRGYRRDCSGYVSMAWKLRKSYTSSSIRKVSRRIWSSQLKPGDAVRRRGHVEIFGGWKNKRRRQYWALGEFGRGRPAGRKVKRFKRGYTALRLKGIRDKAPRKRRKKKTVKRPAPKPTPAPAPSPVRSVPASPFAPPSTLTVRVP